ncbi:MAG: phosphotransferase, partial [Candidatus Eisenbacteria bacterium]|nr:phosphotransferase [Candidatus Eisenbacteria bacterium]
GDLYARHLFVTVPAGDGDSDAKRLELGASDTGASDAGASDASASDTGASDTGASDASPPSGMGRSIALSAIIDWGDVHAGDPAVDLSIAVGFLPPTARTVFAAAYGPIDDETWERARFRAIQHAAVTAVYAHDVGDADWLEESLRSLTHATL